MFPKTGLRRCFSLLLICGLVSGCNSARKEKHSATVSTQSAKPSSKKKAKAEASLKASESPKKVNTSAAGAKGGVSRKLPEAKPSPKVAPSSKALPASKAELEAPKAPVELSPTVKVTLKASPKVPARVRMGGKRLGTIQPGRTLVIERPRDSGPLDLLVRSQGFIPVHTRAYTFEDSVMTIKLTLKEEEESLYGYRKPLPPPDAGVPEP